MEKPSQRSRQQNQKILKKSKSPTSAQKCASSVFLLAQTKKSKFLEHALRAPERLIQHSCLIYVHSELEYLRMFYSKETNFIWTGS